MLQLLLEHGGYHVVSARTVEEAATHLEREAFDLVLADFLVDTVSAATSWEAIQRLVELARPTPLGLITGWPIVADQLQANVAFVLRKPCSRDALFAQLVHTLQVPALSEIEQTRVREYFKSLEAHAFQKLGQLCTDDVVYELPGNDPRFSNQIHGRDAFVAFTGETFQQFRDAHFEVGSITPLPQGALVEYVGTWRENAERRRLPGAVMFEFRHDRIARIGVRVDPERLV